MKILLALAWLLILVGVAHSQKQCTDVSPTSQNCIATISWIAPTTGPAPANYIIRRSDGGGAKTQIGTVSATSKSFQNTFTDAGNVAHCWDVTSTLAGQSSPASTEVCWTTPAIVVTPVAPNAPVGVTIAAISSSSLRITWDDTEGETGYEIWGRTAKGAREYSKLAAVAVDVTTWDWMLRRKYTSYCVEVLATGNPNSPMSTPACATTSK